MPEDVECVLWDDAAAETFLRTQPAPMQALYRRARNYGEASDILRLLITHRLGGLYVDWDVLLLDGGRFLDLLGSLEGVSPVLLEDQATQEQGFAKVVTNSMFYMEAGNPLAPAFLDQIATDLQASEPQSTPHLTGPMALTRFIAARPDLVERARFVDLSAVYSFSYADVKLHPDREELKAASQFGKAPAVHFWTHSWMKQGMLRTALGSFWRSSARTGKRSVRVFNSRKGRGHPGDLQDADQEAHRAPCRPRDRAVRSRSFLVVDRHNRMAAWFSYRAQLRRCWRTSGSTWSSTSAPMKGSSRERAALL